MEAVATIWDMVLGAAGVLSGVFGAYMALVNRLTRLEGVAEGTKEDLSRHGEGLAKVAETVDKLVRREYRREGAERARSEPSGVQDIPTARLHVGTDTTL